MTRVVVSAFGGPEQLRVEPMANAPRPGPGELSVDVEAAGINYVDVHRRKGIHKLPSPFAPGLEGVGRVREIGAGVAVSRSARSRRTPGARACSGCGTRTGSGSSSRPSGRQAREDGDASE
jgi:NADPH:quinone reductase-like Zn-dependent oxidoreductase